MKKFKLRSFAKINLSLRVIKKLNDEYHRLQSFVVFCKIYDLISLEEIFKNKDIIKFVGKFKDNISAKNNTILNTLKCLRKKGYLTHRFFKIIIRKNIPHGSGMGSGSVNAACLLNFFNSKYDLCLNKKALYIIAKNIGSDVPLSLNFRNSFVTGKKDKILRFKKKLNLNLLIIYPNIICSTKKIFLKNRSFSRHINFKSYKIKTKKNLIDFLQKENNDLQVTTFKVYPKTKKLHEVISLQSGCYFSRITGSGSSCVGVFSNMKNLIKAKKNIYKIYPKYWYVIAKTI